MKNGVIKISYWSSSLGFSVFQVIQGLFFHPYQTVQFLVRKDLFKILIFSPILILLFFKLVFVFLGAFEFFPELKTLKTFLWFWIKYFCLIWQLVLCYLFFRFWYAWKTKK
ncbi:MAG: hypothetical protein ACOZAK_04540 [Patescibacteria group bacterium]